MSQEARSDITVAERPVARSKEDKVASSGGSRELGPRRAQIDSLRAIAIGWVLFDHFALVAGTGPVGRLGVRTFLIISGYLITHILLSGRAAAEERRAISMGGVLRSFYARRALRILPVYLTTIGLTWLLFADQFDGSLLWHLSFQSSILFALRNDWGPPWQLGHLWTLSVQEQFYLLWPLVILFTRRRALPLAILAIAAIGPIFRCSIMALGLVDTAAAYTLLPASITAICAGAWAAMLERGGGAPRWLAHRRPYWLVAALGLFALVNLTPHPDWLYYLFFEYVWLIPLMSLLVSASLGIEGIVGRVLDQPWLQYLGRISLGIYLFQVLAYEVVMWILRHMFHMQITKGPLIFALATMLSIASATISWTVMEEPINKLKRFFPYRA